MSQNDFSSLHLRSFLRFVRTKKKTHKTFFGKHDVTFFRKKKNTKNFFGVFFGIWFSRSWFWCCCCWILKFLTLKQCHFIHSWAVKYKRRNSITVVAVVHFCSIRILYTNTYILIFIVIILKFYLSHHHHYYYYYFYHPQEEDDDEKEEWHDRDPLRSVSRFPRSRRRCDH